MFLIWLFGNWALGLAARISTSDILVIHFLCQGLISPARLLWVQRPANESCQGPSPRAIVGRAKEAKCRSMCRQGLLPPPYAPPCPVNSQHSLSPSPPWPQEELIDSVSTLQKKKLRHREWPSIPRPRPWAPCSTGSCPLLHDVPQQRLFFLSVSASCPCTKDTFNQCPF